jgi:hypothetical protein
MELPGTPRSYMELLGAKGNCKELQGTAMELRVTPWSYKGLQGAARNFRELQEASGHCNGAAMNSAELWGAKA